MSTISFALLWNAGLATVLAIVVSLVSRWKHLRNRPALVHALWLLVLAKLVTPPLVPVPLLRGIDSQKAVQRALERPTRADAVGQSGLSSEWTFLEGQEAAFEREGAVKHGTSAGQSIPSSALLGGVWAMGTLLLVTWGVTQYLRVSRVLRFASGGDQRLMGLAQAAAVKMGIGKLPIVSTVEAAIAPLLWVRRKNPLVVLPMGLVREMSDEQLACIFCHELAHYVRRDHWSNTFALLVNAMFWWHPVAWWARREMRAAQEVCCDGLALVAGGVTRRGYAETLFRALEFVQSNQPLQPALASGFGGSSSLQRRFEMIATLHVSQRLSFWTAALVVACFAATLCLPVRAQLKTQEATWVESAAMQHEHSVNIVVCNLDWVGVGDEGGNVFVWDAKTLKERKLLMKGVRDGGHNHWVDRLQFIPDGTNLYAVLDNRRAMWQLHLTKQERPSGGIGGEDPTFFGFSADAELWLETHGKNVLALRPNMWTRPAPGFEWIEYQAEITHGVLSPDQQRLAVVTADEKLHIHDRASLRETQTIDLTRQPVIAIQFSPDGDRLAVVGERGFAKVYDTASGKEIVNLKGHDGIVFAVAFSPDGKTIVTGGGDNSARVWDAATGKPLAVLAGHKDSVKSVAFDPSGDAFYTGSTDKTVRVWKRR